MVLKRKNNTGTWDVIATNTEVVDNVTTDDSTKALSAKQGKLLQDGKLSLSGGTMTGAIVLKQNAQSMCGSSDAQYVDIHGGTNNTTSASLTLFGKDYGTGSNFPGAFRLMASNGTDTKQLMGLPDGRLLWNGKDISSSTGQSLAGQIYETTSSADISSQLAAMYGGGWVQDSSNIRGILSTASFTCTPANGSIVNQDVYLETLPNGSYCRLIVRLTVSPNITSSSEIAIGYDCKINGKSISELGLAPMVFSCANATDCAKVGNAYVAGSNTLWLGCPSAATPYTWFLIYSGIVSRSAIGGSYTMSYRWRRW